MMSISFQAPDLLVFDLDGCLVDSLPVSHRSANLVRALLGKVSVDEVTIADCMGGTTRAFVRRVLAARSTPVPEIEMPGLLRVYGSLYERVAARMVSPYPDVTEVLRALLADGRSIAVCTNKAERLARLTLAYAGLSRFFEHDAIIGYDTLQVSKPHPLPLRRLMERFKTAAELTWMIGDSASDIAVAHAASCTAVFCTYGYGSAGEHRPDATIARATDLLQLARVQSAR